MQRAHFFIRLSRFIESACRSTRDDKAEICAARLKLHASPILRISDVADSVTELHILALPEITNLIFSATWNRNFEIYPTLREILIGPTAILCLCSSSFAFYMYN